MSRRLHKVLGWLRSAIPNNAGGAAVEFGLVAPVLALSVLCVVDLGLALRERISMDSALRAGVQSAFADPGADELRGIVATIAETDFTVSAAEAEVVSSTELLLQVDRFCACPENMGTEVSCAAGCASAASPYVYYSLAAEKYYDPALLPQISLRSALLVLIE